MANDATRGDDEIRRLQGFINDLISIQALPAIWSKLDSSHILSTLLEVLVSVLRLDFAYARLSDSADASAAELVRLAQRRVQVAPPQEIGRALDRWLTPNSATAPLSVPNPVGDGEVTIAPVRLGLLDEIGVLVAGSKRTDFPTQTETLLLRMAANQALVALQEARQLNERKRAAEELERRVVERTEALRASEEKYRTLFESMDEGFCTLEVLFDANEKPIDLRVLEVNPAFEKQTGIQNVRGKRMRELIVLEDHWFEIYGRIALTGEPARFENEAATLHRWFDVYAFRIGEPQERKVAVLFQDVTERKQAEKELQRNEMYLAEGQRLSHTASWAWNVSTGEVYWSLEHFRIFGLDPEKTKPSYETFCQMVHPNDRQGTTETFDQAVRERTGYEALYRIVRPDGTIRHVHALGHPVINGFTEYVGTVMDITERKQAEEELRKTRDELAQVTRVSTIGELAASIAHEINQPLGAIINNSNACVRLFGKRGTNKEIREALSDIVSDANRASGIITSIRALTKKTAPENTSLSLKDVVADTLALAHHTLTQGRITVRTELTEDLPRVPGDRVQFQQVLLNLVMNAIEAMSDVEQNRRVMTITGQRGELEGKTVAVISVQDLGSGFKTEDLERLFQPFYSTKPHGMGMGLRISRSIVEAHGGRLWATTNAGPGATFACAFPAEEKL